MSCARVWEKLVGESEAMFRYLRAPRPQRGRRDFSVVTHLEKRCCCADERVRKVCPRVCAEAKRSALPIVGAPVVIQRLDSVGCGVG